MTLEELKGLRHGEIVVITKVDDKITEYHNYQVGDELLFIDINGDVVNFVRKGEVPVIAHFSYEFFHYIERKIKIERENKLISLGI
jgi:hypothetical protein